MAKAVNGSGTPRGLLTGVVILAAALGVALTMVAGCGDLTGDISPNKPPIVEFANVPADSETFSYAPVVHWKGRDPDGFVEFYYHADVIDSAALRNPLDYIPFIPREAWVADSATSDTVYLLTETGKVTQHIFYLKCVDDRGAESAVQFRTFYRSNRPPRVPEIKWFADGDDTYDERITVADTVYSLDDITETWPGLGFNWRASDPDDRDLYRIPLQFRYFLERVPHDTIWQWVARDWMTLQDTTLSGLETGHYTFTVWARDDGYEISQRPATATFDVYKPSFEQTILLFNTTKEGYGGRNRGNILPGTQVGDLYRQLAGRYPDAEYFHFPNPDSTQPFKSYLGRFRLVIWFSENFDATSAPYETQIRDYVRIGGRLWVIGAFTRKNLISNTTLALTESIFAGPTTGVTVPGNQAEFTGAVSKVRDLPSLQIDTSRSADVWRSYFGGGYGVYPLLPGVDIMTAGSGVQTAYQFSSYTDTSSGDVPDERAYVVASVDTIYYPPTAVDCIIKLVDPQTGLPRPRVLRVDRVENITRGRELRREVLGHVQSLTNNVGSTRQTVVRVSYPYGEPWSVDDTVQVAYEFQPYSELHQKPCGIRYEKLIEKPGGSFGVLYRVAVFTFPLYFLDNSRGDVTRMFNGMLDWFFVPYAH